jgi:D-beta-D-heptose 7-phosphate kinase/D-beta-D-heptose 1-phosphate adenosyltransferase
MNSALVAFVRDAKPVRVGVVGDVILDRYMRGETRRISPEAPIPVLDVGEEDLRLGGAGNVAANLVAAGASVWLGGVVGVDVGGGMVRDKLRALGVDVSAVVRDAKRPTVEKTRLIARSQQVLRVDREDRRPLDGDIESSLARAVAAAAAASDMIVASDYAKGTLTPAVLRALLASGRPVLVDPKGTDYTRYRGAFGITPNRGEAEAATGVTIRDADSLRAAAARLFELVGATVVFITLGEGGIYCSSRSGEEFHVHAEARHVFDVTGAGDTVIALLARYLAAGVPLRAAVEIANAAAGVVVGKIGAGTVTAAELYRALGDDPGDAGRKILRREDAAGVARDLKTKGLRVVFTNGCFDLLHAGHARYLAQARAQVDVLIVGLNDDASVRRLKGAERPLVPLEDRAQLLASLAAVDFVVPFAEDTPEELIREVGPDVLVKGRDYEGKPIAGREFVESRGGRVFLAPLLEGRSTSSLLARLRGL